MKDALVNFGVHLSKRKSKKEKFYFLNTITKNFATQKIPYTLQEESGKLATCRNLYVGDIEKSKIVLVSAYDTGSKMLLKLPYYPLNAKKNIINESINLIMYSLFAILCILLIFLSSPLILSASIIPRFIGILIDGALITIIYLTMLMPSANFNMNRNTASVALLYKLAEKKLDSISYAFTDYSVTTYLGYKLLANYCNSAGDKKIFIIIDSIASGETLYILHNKESSKANELAKLLDARLIHLTEEEFKATPMSGFDHSIMLTSGSLIDKDLKIFNQRNKSDYKIDIKRMEVLYEKLYEYLHTVKI